MRRNCLKYSRNIPRKMETNLLVSFEPRLLRSKWYHLGLLVQIAVGLARPPTGPSVGGERNNYKDISGGPSQDICIWGGPSPKPLPFLPCGHQSCPIWPSPWPYPQLSDSIFGIGVKLGRAHYKLVEIIIKSFRSCLLSKFLKIFKCQRGLKSIIYGLLWLWTVQSPL